MTTKKTTKPTTTKAAKAAKATKRATAKSDLAAAATPIATPDLATPTVADTTPPATTAATPPAKAATKTKAKREPKAGLSMLDAAAQVLATASDPMDCQALIGAMAAKGLWASPNGKTPAATLSAALHREITVKGADSRFQKVGRGQFALVAAK